MAQWDSWSKSGRAEIIIIEFVGFIAKVRCIFFRYPKSVSERTKSINILREKFMMIRCGRYRKNEIKYMRSSPEPHSIAQHISKHLNNNKEDRAGEAIACGLWHKIQNPKCKFTYFLIHFTISSSFFHWNSIETKQKGTKYFWFYVILTRKSPHIFPSIIDKMLPFTHNVK